ncbi:MAG: PIG-L family deacetylase [Rubricoccaceae bacterium]
MLRLLPFLALLALATPVCAQSTPPSLDALASSVDRPDRPLVVMNLAGHPDDEDGLTMTYYRGNQDAVVYSVIYTRGEGGQNEIGPDLYERLGAIRTQETEAAARIYGTHVLYLDRYDFGFSKHAWETFDEWSRERGGFWDTDAPKQGSQAGRDALVADLVHLIRRLKPDVMFTNHDTSTAWPNAQHGHHQAVGISAYDAFELAADPTYQPAQLEEDGVDLWQPKRLFLRRGGFSSGAPDDYDAAIPVSDLCAATTVRPEEACHDRAVAGVALHVSQGFDKFAPRFRRDTTYFVLLRESDDAPPLPEDATDLAAGLAPNPHIDAISLGTLVDSGRLPALDGLTVSSPTVVPSEDVFVRWTAGSPARTLTVLPPAGAPTEGLIAARSASASLDKGGVRVVVPSGTQPSAPRHRAQYSQPDGTLPYLYAVYEGDELVAGGRLPLEIVPPATVDLGASPVVLTAGRMDLPVDVQIFHALTDSVNFGATVYSEDKAAAFNTQYASSEESSLPFSLNLESLEPGRYRIIADARTTGCGLPWYRDSLPAAVLPDVSVAPGLRVGLVRSYDDATEVALQRMGAEVVLLDSLALAESRFDGLHTIVLDIRAYLVRPDLKAHNANLLEWVTDGGHMVVGYHKTFEWNGEDLAPYTLRLGRDRVTMEDAPVKLRQPDHVLFRAPHTIVDSDWDGWVQERGLYFPAEWDERYTELVETGDRGEDPLTSGLLIADVGEGTYAYNALVWYRQLAALNPGAFRLFANLVSLPLTDGRDVAAMAP